MTIWMTSDTHFHHANIIKYCNRPFENAYKMTEQLITNWNDVVQPDDDIYHLGDFAFKVSKGRVVETLSRLNGNKYFLAGNHDQSLFTRDSEYNIVLRESVVPYVKWIKDYFELNVQDKSMKRGHVSIVLGHYAFRVWNRSHHGTWNLYGHSHGMLPEENNVLAIDVGVDAVAMRNSVDGKLDPLDYRPISYDEVKKIMESKNFSPITRGE